MGSRGSSSKIGEGRRQTSSMSEVIRDNTNSVDVHDVMQDAYFSSIEALFDTIYSADGGRYDVDDSESPSEDFGTIRYYDTLGSDGDRYVIDWRRDYSDPERKRIQVVRFRHFMEGEW